MAEQGLRRSVVRHLERIYLDAVRNSTVMGVMADPVWVAATPAERAEASRRVGPRARAIRDETQGAR